MRKDAVCGRGECTGGAVPLAPRPGGEGAGGGHGGGGGPCCSSPGGSGASDRMHNRRHTAARSGQRQAMQKAAALHCTRRPIRPQPHRFVSAAGCSAFSPPLPSWCGWSAAPPLAATGVEQATTAERRGCRASRDSRPTASCGGGQAGSGAAAANCCCCCRRSWTALQVPVACRGWRAALRACKRGAGRAGEEPRPRAAATGILTGAEIQACIEDAI